MFTFNCKIACTIQVTDHVMAGLEEIIGYSGRNTLRVSIFLNHYKIFQYGRIYYMPYRLTSQINCNATAKDHTFPWQNNYVL